MTLVVCSECRRHVAIGETACPFCAAPILAPRPQHAVVGRITRAAVFSAAALTSACKDKPASTPAATPAPVHAGSGSGSDDLEKLLDTDDRVVEHPSPPADAAVPVDAAVAVTPADASVDDQERARQREAQRRKREALRREALERQQQQLEEQKLRVQNVAKPYGAPPARRRVV